jgi:hypothetical protein
VVGLRGLELRARHAVQLIERISQATRSVCATTAVLVGSVLQCLHALLERGNVLVITGGRLRWAAQGRAKRLLSGFDGRQFLILVRRHKSIEEGVL